MTNIDDKLAKLADKRNRLLEQEKALKQEMRQLENRKKAVARKNRSRDLILFGTEFFRKGRLDYETDYKGFVQFLNESGQIEKLISEYQKGGCSW